MYKLEELFNPAEVNYIKYGVPSGKIHKYAYGESRVYHGENARLTELGEHVFTLAGCKIDYRPPRNSAIHIPDHLIRALTGEQNGT